MDKTPYIKYKNIYIIPTFHSRLEFAKLVRKAFFMVFPDVVCVELPDNIRDEVLEGIDRLPYLSLIAYADTLNPKKLNFVPIDPGDSIIEAIRTGDITERLLKQPSTTTSTPPKGSSVLFLLKGVCFPNRNLLSILISFLNYIPTLALIPVSLIVSITL